ncbi:hypothetical protein Tco_1138019 [Tanacetum coccineum]
MTASVNPSLWSSLSINSSGSQTDGNNTQELLAKLLSHLGVTGTNSLAQTITVAHLVLLSTGIPNMQMSVAYHATAGPSGFSCGPSFVQDFMTHRVLLRCDSTRDLYPVTTPSPIPHAFLTGQSIRGTNDLDMLRRLVSRNFISCNKEKPPVLCHACQLGKHIRLPFVSSNTSVTSRFDIVHSDVWTSPISSLSGFKSRHLTHGISGLGRWKPSWLRVKAWWASNKAKGRGHMLRIHKRRPSAETWRT